MDGKGIGDAFKALAWGFLVVGLVMGACATLATQKACSTFEVKIERKDAGR